MRFGTRPARITEAIWTSRTARAIQRTGDPLEMLVFTYLISGRLASATGMFQISADILAIEIGFSLDQSKAEAILARLEERGFLSRCSETDYVWVHGMADEHIADEQVSWPSVRDEVDDIKTHVRPTWWSAFSARYPMLAGSDEAFEKPFSDPVDIGHTHPDVITLDSRRPTEPVEPELNETGSETETGFNEFNEDEDESVSTGSRKYPDYFEEFWRKWRATVAKPGSKKGAWKAIQDLFERDFTWEYLERCAHNYFAHIARTGRTGVHMKTFFSRHMRFAEFADDDSSVNEKDQLAEKVLAEYPPIPGNNKAQAYQAIRQRLSEGYTADYLAERARAYREYVTLHHQGTNGLIHAKTYFGADKRFQDDWSVDRAVVGGQSSDAEIATRALEESRREQRDAPPAIDPQPATEGEGMIYGSRGIPEELRPGRKKVSTRTSVVDRNGNSIDMDNVLRTHDVERTIGRSDEVEPEKSDDPFGPPPMPFVERG